MPLRVFDASHKLMDTSVESHYDKRGEKIISLQTNSYPKRHEQFFIRNILAQTENFLPPPDSSSLFLDLCCGTGLFSIHPAKMGYAVTGVDLSPKSILAAQWLSQENGVADKCRFIAEDVVDFLQTSKMQFDVIQIYSSLYYFDFEVILPLIKQRLKPGGRWICVETNGSQPMMNLVRRLRALIWRDRDQRTLSHLTHIQDVKRIGNFFPNQQLKFLDFFSLLALPLVRWPALAKTVHLVGSWMDAFFIETLGLKFLAFKIVILAKNE